MIKPTARSTALRVLTACRTASAWADAALNAQLARNRLPEQDAALATRIVYGIMQNQLYLDHCLSSYCTQKINHLQPPLADILRIGAYQIIYLDRIPDSAAVNESVNLAKLSGRSKASGLVNAVLRKVSQNKNQLPPVPKFPVLRRLSIQYSHPKWLVKRLLTLLGEVETEAFLQCNNHGAPVTIQTNPIKTTTEDLLSHLTTAGVTAKPHPWIPDCLELNGTGDLTKLESFRQGTFQVQDGAAKLVTLAATPMPGNTVIDVCAAPGGKSFSLAMAMGNQGKIVSCDLHPNKLKRVQEGANRLGLSCIETIAADGKVPQPGWAACADVVLVDAPCSGLGIIRKKPDIRYKKPNDLFALPVIQTAILENAATYVKPGGTLVYSTCTILPEENEQLTDAFLAEHPEYSREPFDLPKPVGKVDGQITFWPQKHDTDGFYICRMKRRK